MSKYLKFQNELIGMRDKIKELNNHTLEVEAQGVLITIDTHMYRIHKENSLASRVEFVSLEFLQFISNELGLELDYKGITFTAEQFLIEVLGFPK